MSSTAIEVNTGRLKTDAESVSVYIKAMQSQLDEMEKSVAELNVMWEGPAKEAFVKKFHSDEQDMLSVIKELEAIYSYEDQAKSVYEQCEKTINGMINDITV